MPEFIESLYFKRFGKERPDEVRSIEQVVKEQNKKKEERRKRKEEKRRLEQSQAELDEVPF